ncbi:hypothetical protein NE237_017503 [Protea cynaroides]|uniref:Uncharacterized protein n=1 Tax=Protea cynaroides TaxID=273540 RepID=A0A9Q0QN97_9MAGN|nr:hypothetical protein NE237_017503 [Protea cynaroides]
MVGHGHWIPQIGKFLSSTNNGQKSNKTPVIGCEHLHLTSSLAAFSLSLFCFLPSQPQEKHQNAIDKDLVIFSLSLFFFFFFFVLGLQSSAEDTMSSIRESVQKRGFFPTRPVNEDLPISQKNPMEQGFRRRLSSISMRINHISSPAVSSFSFIPRSKSMSAVGESAGSSIKKWWDRGWAWILSKKPAFARDLEMNEVETAMMGYHNKGSWKHVLYKVRSEFRKLRGSNNVGLPQTFRYDSYNYSKNFDDTKAFH